LNKVTDPIGFQANGQVIEVDSIDWLRFQKFRRNMASEHHLFYKLFLTKLIAALLSIFGTPCATFYSSKSVGF
jgi:hypothetical protein